MRFDRLQNTIVTAIVSALITSLIFLSSPARAIEPGAFDLAQNAAPLEGMDLSSPVIVEPMREQPPLNNDVSDLEQKFDSNDAPIATFSGDASAAERLDEDCPYKASKDNSPTSNVETPVGSNVEESLKWSYPGCR